MAKRGPKAIPASWKIVAGMGRPDRKNSVAHDALEGDATLPAQFQALREHRPLLTAVVLEIWNSILDKYRHRGQSTAGYDRALYQMCLLEATIHESARLGIDSSASLVNALRIYYSEFHDTPAANTKPRGTPEGNRFSRNERRSA